MNLILIGTISDSQHFVFGLICALSVCFFACVLYALIHDEKCFHRPRKLQAYDQTTKPQYSHRPPHEISEKPPARDGAITCRIIEIPGKVATTTFAKYDSRVLRLPKTQRGRS